MNTVKCEQCGEEFDRRNLGEVLRHIHKDMDAHTLMDATGMVGRKIRPSDDELKNVLRRVYHHLIWYTKETSLIDLLAETIRDFDIPLCGNTQCRIHQINKEYREVATWRVGKYYSCEQCLDEMSQAYPGEKYRIADLD